MCAHPLHTKLDTAADRLREAAGSLEHHPVSPDALRCAVRQARRLATELAQLANTLAHHVQTDINAGTLRDVRPHSAPTSVTLREVTEDLRTMAKHLHTSDVLLEPADDDLAHVRPDTRASSASAGHASMWHHTGGNGTIRRRAERP